MEATKIKKNAKRKDVCLWKHRNPRKKIKRKWVCFWRHQKSICSKPICLCSKQSVLCSFGIVLWMTQKPLCPKQSVLWRHRKLKNIDGKNRSVYEIGKKTGNLLSKNDLFLCTTEHTGKWNVPSQSVLPRPETGGGVAGSVFGVYIFRAELLEFVFGALPRKSAIL